jgi:dihydroneopterin aldolase
MMSDRIVLEGIEFYGYHGVSEAERVTGRRFTVDLSVKCDLRKAGLTDDVADTIDYGKLARQVIEIARGKRFKLIEALAEAIAAGVLENERAESVRVRVRKLHPPIDDVIAAATVEIKRKRA